MGAKTTVRRQAYPDRATAERAALEKGVINFTIAVEKCERNVVSAKAELAIFKQELSDAKARVAALKD